MSQLGFISEHDFKKHVEATIKNYGNKLSTYNLAKFNNNVVDPIKLIFDKTIYNYSWEEIIKHEISRQRDKSNNNDIGHFHQRIFQYVDGCTIPQSGWDVVFTRENGIVLPDGDKIKTIYVEMKNKHNTMNSASSSKTYINMQSQLLKNDDCACFLVEAIAKQSQNITWIISVNGERQQHRRIRRISMDEFYSIVTGEPDAFYKMCMALPSVIEEIIESSDTVSTPCDTVIEELKEIAQVNNGSFAIAMYMLGFPSYKGFNK